MKEPLVSVLSITYNHVSYVAQAIESFLAQHGTFPFEIVIGEDCSTDGTREVVLDFAQRYPDLIRVVTSDKNVGGNANFRRAFQMCRGKYIAICEGDDYWHHRGKLQRQVEFLEANPDYGMVHTDFDTFYACDQSVVNSWFASHGVTFPGVSNVHISILLGEYPISTCTICFERSLLAEAMSQDGFNGRFTGGDLQVKAALAYRKKVGYLPESMATYRHLEESASHSRNPVRQLAWTESCAALHDHLCDLYNIDHATRVRIRDKWVHSRLAAAFRAGDKAAALRAYEDLSKGTSLTHVKAAAYALASRYSPIRFALDRVLRWKTLARTSCQPS